MSIRVRFAPSPTGQVHIGNIRAAIFNWLFARHEGGAFLLRIEDTDRERSTPQAIAALLDVMQWLGLDVDEPPLYQTSRMADHLAAAQRLVAEGWAYRSAKGGEQEAVLFRIPWDAEQVPGVSSAGIVELDVHPDVPVSVEASGINYALRSNKGKPMPQAGCLAGFRGLEVFDGGGACLLRLDERIDEIRRQGCTFVAERPVRLRFERRQIEYTDLVKGTLAKPLDSLRDFVIVRSDGSPVFHLANVCDDVAQGVTHIIRGDDHVENTYRHIFLFAALRALPPRYAHLPMIVNAAGKPYSKRDGDAFVGDFRDKGYLPEALFNYLTLLGWSPGDDREKMTREEIVEAFSLDRVQSAPARVDLKKLDNLNGRYMAELPADRFVADAWHVAAKCPWAEEIDEQYFARVARLMQSRTKRYTDVEQWAQFFLDVPDYDPHACGKFLRETQLRNVLARVADSLGNESLSEKQVEHIVHECEAAAGMPDGRVNQPLRVAVTGMSVGAGIFETVALLGPARSRRRIQYALAECCSGAQ